MSKATAGPWEVEYAQTGVRWPVIVAKSVPGYDDGSPYQVCEISESFPIKARPANKEREVAEANARLIAAAPDLLAVAIDAKNALAAILPVLHSMKAENEFAETAIKIGEAVKAKARAAIARATEPTK